MNIISRLISLLVIISVVSGCSFLDNHQKLYEIRMMNGDTLYAISEPRLDDQDYYRFNDVNKQQYILNKNLVLFIEKVKVEK